MDCDSRHISAIETGAKRPSINLLAKISEALDTSVDYFLLDAPHINREYYIDGYSVPIVQSFRNFRATFPEASAVDLAYQLSRKTSDCQGCKHRNGKPLTI